MASSSWNSSPHPISDLRDWNDLQRLEINPAYQRGEVWSSSAKVMLIDSILSDIPMPKILVSKKIVDGSTYSRLNKYTFALNKQELRRADYPGDFLNISQSLAENEKLNEFNIFSPSLRRRLGDIEYTSELIAFLVDGIQDKKKDLDSFYINYKNWEEAQRADIENRFELVLNVIDDLFKEKEVRQTRFRQKADFYSLFAAVDIFNRMNIVISDTDKDMIFEVVELLDSGISPSSEVDLFKHYAVRCISDANSHSTRLWRAKFLFSMLFSPFINENYTETQERAYVSILSDLPYLHDSGMCPIAYPECSECDETKSDNEDRLLVAWNAGERKTLINAFWVHQKCIKGNEYVVIDNTDLYPPYRDSAHSKLFGLSDLSLS